MTHFPSRGLEAADRHTDREEKQDGVVDKAVAVDFHLWQKKRK